MNASIRTKIPKRKGFALVIVLASLVFLSALILSFLSSAGAERQAAQVSSNAASVKQLADTAVNIVMAQIKVATAGGSSINPIAWASQPGMIRTYDANGASAGAYKLYSSQNLLVSSTSTVSAKLELNEIANWNSDTALFTDLNEPVTSGNGTLFPILDPTVIGGAKGVIGISSDPANKSVKTRTPTAPDQAPMPVRWLYVLKNGEIVAPQGTGATASIQGVDKNNPVTGRIAFWTDDETSKVNINTSAGGAFWDTPRLNTSEEFNFALRQPAAREYQRFSGHPAMTSLRPLFPSLGFPLLTDDALYQLVPRLEKSTGSGAGTTVTLDSDRLYSSVDELNFKPDRGNYANGVTPADLAQRRFFLTASSRAPEVNLFNQPRVAVWPVDTRPDYQSPYDKLIAFCSTIGDPATSSKRYQYYFQRQNRLSSTDDYDKISRNQSVYKYLQNLTNKSFPGFGGNLGTKYGVGGTGDRDQILTEIFDYIRSTNLAYDFDGSGKTYTPASTSATGRGEVVPITIGKNTGNETRGFGRYITIPRVGVLFICNAAGSNNPATAVNEAAVSNTTSNLTLGGTLLTANQKRIQAMFLMDFFSPSLGWIALRNDVKVTVEGLDTWKVQDSGGNIKNLSIPAKATLVLGAGGWGTSPYGGQIGWRTPLIRHNATALPPLAADVGLAPVNVYPFISVPITIDAPSNGGTMNFISGGPVKISVATNSTSEVVQTINVEVPSATLPIPELVVTPTGSGATSTVMQEWWTFSRDGIDGSAGPLAGRLFNADGDPGYFDPAGTTDLRTNPSLFTTSVNARGGMFLRAEDVLRTVQVKDGDVRLVAAKATVNTNATDPLFPKFPNDAAYDEFSASPPAKAYTTGTSRLRHQFSGNNDYFYPGFDLGGKLVTSATYITTATPASRNAPRVTPGATTANDTGDWDNGLAKFHDGAFINKPDEGNLQDIGVSGKVPYYSTDYQEVPGGTGFFSPNRMIPSAGMFGSLSTGVKAQAPWQTLLFRPQPGHPKSWKSSSFTKKGGNDGLTPDHLFLDLFWMPVVEPYALSEPFSTAGKVNLNYQIMPFTYIERKTALHAALENERVLAIPVGTNGINGTRYKQNSDTANGAFPTSVRNVIDVDQTLKQFDARFASDDIFRAASEICDIHLIPKGTTITQNVTSTDADAVMKTFWTANALTGDNSRERPYANLYGRITTKSNTFTVHYRVQQLRQIPAGRTTPADWGIWKENTDKVEGEYRGSTIIERYVDPTDSRLPDYATDANPAPIDTFYKFRVLSTKRLGVD